MLVEMERASFQNFLNCYQRKDCNQRFNKNSMDLIVKQKRSLEPNTSKKLTLPPSEKIMALYPTQDCPPSNLDVSSAPLSTAAWVSAVTFSTSRLMWGIITRTESSVMTPEITNARIIRYESQRIDTEYPLQRNDLDLQLFNRKREHMIGDSEAENPFISTWGIRGDGSYQSRKKTTTPPPTTRTIQMKMLANNLPNVPWTWKATAPLWRISMNSTASGNRATGASMQMSRETWARLWLSL